MSKKYKGKICVYCQEGPSINQGDHVFARSLFLKHERSNPIKVPACDICNNRKSFIENYLATLLPFGANHKHARETLNELVPPRLDRNIKLRNELKQGMQYVNLKPDDKAQQKRLAIPFDGSKFAELFKYITKALSWYYWGSYIQISTGVLSTSLTETGEEAFENFLFSLNSDNRVEKTIGENTVYFKGHQAVDDDQITVWKFQIYNGIYVRDSTLKSPISSSCVGVLTGPKNLIESYEELFE